MTGNNEQPKEVFMFLEERLPDRAVLRMSLNHHPAEYFSVEVSSHQLTQLTGLYSLAPDTFRQLMNTLVNAAYQAGSADKEEEISALYQGRLEAFEISEALKTGRKGVIEIIDGIPQTF